MTAPGPSVDDLSVPLEYTLPPRWEQLDPETNGAPGSAMLALYEERGETFTPSITIGIQRRTDDAGLQQVAEEAVARLAQVAQSVELVDRQEVGSGHAPGITQTLLLVTSFGGVTQELVQSQVHIEVPLVPPTPGEVPTDRLAVELTGTSTREQASTVLRDFQAFVDSVHLEVRADPPEAGPRHASPPSPPAPGGPSS